MLFLLFFFCCFSLMRNHCHRVLKIDCYDYDHVFEDDQNIDEYLAAIRQGSPIGVDTANHLSAKDGTLDDSVVESCGGGHESDVENPLPDNLICADGGASHRSIFSSTWSTAFSNDHRDMQQSSRLPVSPRQTFINIRPERDESIVTGGIKGSSSYYQSDASSGLYFDDDNVAVAVDDTVVQQQAIPQLYETGCWGSREEDTTTSSGSNSMDNNHNNDWPTDEEVIDVEAPPGWLGVVIGMFLKQCKLGCIEFAVFLVHPLTHLYSRVVIGSFF
jgi:hypothetical protein